MRFESTLFPPEHDEPANSLQSETAGTVDLPLGEGFSLPTLLENVARYYRCIVIRCSAESRNRNPPRRMLLSATLKATSAFSAIPA